MHNSDIDLILEPTEDVVCVMETCTPCLAPTSRSWLTVFISACSVAPLANLTPLALEYQLYLCRIFHRRSGSFYGHVITMPIVVSLLLALIPTPYEFWAVGTLFLWYAAWGGISGIWWLGPGSLGILSTCYLISEQLRPHDNLWVWLIIFSQLQAWSHVVEDLPPRVSGTPLWVSKSVFLHEVHGSLDLLQRIVRLILTALVFGPLDEFIASPRLLPLFWCLLPGHNIMRWLNPSWTTCRILDDLEAKFQTSISEINPQPAIDYIGVGGGHFVRIRGNKMEVDVESSWDNQIHERDGRCQ